LITLIIFSLRNIIHIFQDIFRNNWSEQR